MLTPKENTQEKSTQKQTPITDGEDITFHSLKDLQGTLFIFCKKAPCFIGDKQTTISCFEYYPELIKITNKNLKIKIFFPKKSKKDYDLTYSLNR